jgi:hypothetical protein
VIVVVAYIAQEDRFCLALEGIVLNRRRAHRSPPCVKMRSGTAAEPGAPPSAIDAARSFVVQPGDVHRHPLQQKRHALADRFVPPSRELIEKLLMAIDQPRWPCCPKLVIEEGGTQTRL